MPWDKAMQDALQADGDKLRAMTGEGHGPAFDEFAPPTDQEIANAFHAAAEEFGDDKSTEFLIAITADRMACDPDEVVSALATCQEQG